MDCESPCVLAANARLFLEATTQINVTYVSYCTDGSGHPQKYRAMGFLFDAVFRCSIGA